MIPKARVKKKRSAPDWLGITPAPTSVHSNMQASRHKKAGKKEDIARYEGSRITQGFISDETRRPINFYLQILVSELPN